ncbi:hypothetical protein [Pseudomonas sp. TTU2014-080ASC]|uniref:hypothetical protein n=1 Tax=Pseudomonas sp. TTU2014-080ASC TaxID=1729724 RepID=UPI0007184066|nr:hypothetical protein [Pseudomonas sp. TTU2014-080ASC]KRW61664.1 hypothetical protein AO726_10165 [Pseudomonas sp. TTU2014-080ASC]
MLKRFIFASALCCSATTAFALDPSGQRYVEQLVQGGAVSIRDAAQSIYHSGYRDVETLDVAAEVLLQRYRNASDNTTSDALAWVCKALASSGNGRYKAVLDEVVANSNNRKMNRHCQKAAGSLSAGASTYVKGSVNLNAYRNGQGKPAANTTAAAAPARTVSVSGTGAFANVRQGMSMDEVNALLGAPTGTYSHQTGKAWNPFNFKGKDVARIVHLYKGKGRIVFSQESVYANVWRVMEITSNPNETGYP